MTFEQQLKQIVADHAPPLPVEVWAQDESRFGLQTIQRRRLTLKGVKPIGTFQQAFATFYLFGVVAPRSGEAYFESSLAFNTAAFQAFVDHFATEYPSTFNILVLDNAKVHHAKALRLPPNLVLLFLPPYAPELNPAERIWLHLKSALAWASFPSLLHLQDAISLRLDTCSNAVLQSLSAFPFFTHAANALFSS